MSVDWTEVVVIMGHHFCPPGRLRLRIVSDQVLNLMPTILDADNPHFIPNRIIISNDFQDIPPQTPQGGLQKNIISIHTLHYRID